MKYFVFFFLIAFSLEAQYVNDFESDLKNSIGLSISTESIGGRNSFNESPTIGLDYRHLLTDLAELRFSAGYQHSNSKVYQSSFYFSAGINRFFYQSPKIGLYGSLELAYNRFPSLISNFDTVPPVFVATNQIESNLLLGVEYKPTSRFRVFLEPRLMSISLFESVNGNGEFQTNQLKFLKTSRLGIKYKF